MERRLTLFSAQKKGAVMSVVSKLRTLSETRR